MANLRTLAVKGGPVRGNRALLSEEEVNVSIIITRNAVIEIDPRCAEGCVGGKAAKRALKYGQNCYVDYVDCAVDLQNTIEIDKFFLASIDHGPGCQNSYVDYVDYSENRLKNF